MKSQPESVVALTDESITLSIAIVRKLAHDISNSLVSAISTLDLVVVDHRELEDLLAPLRRELSRPLAILERPLRTLPSRAMIRPFSLADWRPRIADEAKVLAISIRIPGELPGPTDLDEATWTQCLDNVVRNALDAHKASPRAGDTNPLPGRWVLVQFGGDQTERWCEVSDNGPGHDDPLAAAQSRRARSGAGHLGLGLAVAASQLAKVGGNVVVRRRDGGGWSTTLHWPAP